jgi:FkbM family methyltransferase
MLLRRYGIDISRFDTTQSQDARLMRLLAWQGVDTVLDVGANDGDYGRALLDGGFEGRILSFEPLTQAHRALQHVAAANPRWAVAPRMALGEVDGDAEINVAGNSKSSSVLPMKLQHLQSAPDSRFVGTERVPMHRLDGVKHAFIAEAAGLYLKVDTQGFEMNVLRGASALLQHLRGLQLEMSIAPLYEGQVLYRELLDWVTGHGFELYGLVPGFGDAETGRLLQFDGIFFRDEESVRP